MSKSTCLGTYLLFCSLFSFVIISIFSWLQRNIKTYSNELLRSAQDGFRKLADTKTQKSGLPVHCSYEEEADKSSKLKELDNFEYSTMAWDWMSNLESWTKILCIDWFYATIFSLVLCLKSHSKVSSSHPAAIMIICIDSARISSCHQRCCKRVFNDAAKRMIK